MKVYVLDIREGCGCCHQVEAVFATRELAEEHGNYLVGDGECSYYDVMECEVWDAEPGRVT